MKKRFFFVIKDKICNIVIVKVKFDISLYDDVMGQAPDFFNDICRVNSLDESKLYWEITKK